MPNWTKRLITRLRLYWLAARLYEAYRLLVRPHTHGALVAIWHRQRLLLVQTSYRRRLSLPGGGIHGGESPREAAVRELTEELGLRVAPQELEEPWQLTEASVLGKNTVTIFALRLQHRPATELDGLELMDSRWLSREEALAQPLVDHVRAYLLQLR